MPYYDLVPTSILYTPGGSVAGAATILEALADSSDASYWYHTSQAFCYPRFPAPSGPSGRLCSIGFELRALDTGGASRLYAEIQSVWSDGTSRNHGIGQAYWPAAAFAAYALEAPSGQNPDSVSFLTNVVGDLAANLAMEIVLYPDAGQTVEVAKAVARLYYLPAVTVTTLSAPNGTASQSPELVAPLAFAVESWQISSGTFLCGGDVEYRVYHATDAPDAEPPSGVSPVWSGFERFSETTVGDRTPSVSTTCGALANGDYKLYVRASRDLMDGARLYWSDWESVSWTQNIALPAAPALTPVADDAGQRMALTVNAPATTGYDSSTATIEIERLAGDAWRPVRDVSGAAIAVGSDELVGYDYEAERAADSTYRARVAMYHTADAVTRYSAWAEETVTGPAYLANAWNLKTIEDPAGNWIGAPVLVAPSETDQRQRATFAPLDRSRPIVVSGVLAGMAGDLELEAIGADEIAALEALRDYAGVVLLEDAFGVARYVRILKLSWALHGTREAPRRLAAASYAEVDHGLTETPA